MTLYLTGKGVYVWKNDAIYSLMPFQWTYSPCIKSHTISNGPQSDNVFVMEAQDLCPRIHSILLQNSSIDNHSYTNIYYCRFQKHAYETLCLQDSVIFFGHMSFVQTIIATDKSRLYWDSQLYTYMENLIISTNDESLVNMDGQIVRGTTTLVAVKESKIKNVQSYNRMGVAIVADNGEISVIGKLSAIHHGTGKIIEL